jgi:hypothetical protein
MWSAGVEARGGGGERDRQRALAVPERNFFRWQRDTTVLTTRKKAKFG